LKFLDVFFEVVEKRSKTVSFSLFETVFFDWGFFLYAWGG